MIRSFDELKSACIAILAPQIAIKGDENARYLLASVVNPRQAVANSSVRNGCGIS